MGNTKHLVVLLRHQTLVHPHLLTKEFQAAYNRLAYKLGVGVGLHGNTHEPSLEKAVGRSMFTLIAVKQAEVSVIPLILRLFWQHGVRSWPTFIYPLDHLPKKK